VGSKKHVVDFSEGQYMKEILRFIPGSEKRSRSICGGKHEGNCGTSLMK